MTSRVALGDIGRYGIRRFPKLRTQFEAFTCRKNARGQKVKFDKQVVRALPDYE